MKSILIVSAGQLIGSARRGLAYLDHQAEGRPTSPVSPARITFIETEAATGAEAPGLASRNIELGEEG